MRGKPRTTGSAHSTSRAPTTRPSAPRTRTRSAPTSPPIRTPTGAPRRTGFSASSTAHALAARATLLAAVVAATATPPDHATVVQLLDGFEKRWPDAKELRARALELRLGARVGTGDLDGAGHDLDAFLTEPGDPAER